MWDNAAALYSLTATIPFPDPAWLRPMKGCSATPARIAPLLMLVPGAECRAPASCERPRATSERAVRLTHGRRDFPGAPPPRRWHAHPGAESVGRAPAGCVRRDTVLRLAPTTGRPRHSQRRSTSSALTATGWSRASKATKPPPWPASGSRRTPPGASTCTSMTWSPTPITGARATPTRSSMARRRGQAARLRGVPPRQSGSGGPGGRAPVLLQSRDADQLVSFRTIPRSVTSGG